MSTTIDDFVNTLATEGDALDAFNAIRARFDLAGTVFCTADITETIREMLGEEQPTLVPVLIDAITQDVKDSYVWRKLGDIMSERVSAAIADVVIDRCLPFAPESGLTYTAQLLAAADDDGTTVVAVEGIGFVDAGGAYEWAAGHLGSPVLTVIGTHPTECDLHVPVDARLDTSIESVALVATDADGRVKARFVASPTTGAST